MLNFDIGKVVKSWIELALCVQEVTLRVGRFQQCKITLLYALRGGAVRL